MVVMEKVNDAARAALAGALQLVSERFAGNVLGVLVAGSVLTPHWGPGSDIDLQVVVDSPVTQRLHKLIEGIDADIWVRSETSLLSKSVFFSDTGTLRMFATGSIVLDRDGRVARIAAIARAIFAQPKPPLRDVRSHLQAPVTLLEEARRLAPVDPVAAGYVVFAAVYQLVNLHYAFAGRYIEKTSFVLQDLGARDPAVAATARMALAQTSPQGRLAALERLIELVYVPVGGYARDWESDVYHDRPSHPS